ncbi:MAG TPA: DUF5916 domain-containing protein, partial [Longimicrobiales bacterium]|nr:DUF5916 domain-containing protein [Longimicrobiales bacterium]
MLWWKGAILAAALAAASGVSGQEGGSAPRLRASFVPEARLDLDGWLTEDAWSNAPAGSAFTQRDPDDGSPATERTEVRVLYSRSALYIGVRAYDSEASGIRARLGRRDQVSRSDQVTVFLDSYLDRRSCFEFTVTPAGSIGDAFRTEARGADDSWDPVWDVATSVDGEGWTAELRIPFSQLRFDDEGETWGLQVERIIERKAESAWWAPFSKESGGFAAHFGLLEGLEGLPTPMRLEVRPYAVASTRRRPEGTGSTYQPGSASTFNAGFDLQYGLTSNFTLDLTVNPDFGQVEADPSVVNLTAFETYYPERRPFFVE